MRKAHQLGVFGVALLIVFVDIIYKVFTGAEVGFYEIVALGVFSTFFLSAITWGNQKEKNGILQDEELGKRIVEKSSKISYTILYFGILTVALLDKILNGTTNGGLLLVLTLAIVVLPLVQYVVSRKYQ